MKLVYEGKPCAQYEEWREGNLAFHCKLFPQHEEGGYCAPYPEREHNSREADSSTKHEAYRESELRIPESHGSTARKKIYGSEEGKDNRPREPVENIAARECPYDNGEKKSGVDHPVWDDLM